MHIKNHFKNYCEKIFETSKIRAFWSIENTASFCDAIHRVQITTGLKSIKTGDFSTMFTGLQHNDIKDALFYVINLCFQNCQKKYLVVTFSKTFYSDSPIKNAHNLTIDDLKELIVINIDNCYIRFGSFIMKQQLGVGMGSAVSPQIATLSMMGFESRFILNPKNRHLALQLTNVYRYIDDLASLNCSNFFQIAKLIYPQSLPLEITPSASNTANLTQIWPHWLD